MSASEPVGSPAREIAKRLLEGWRERHREHGGENQPSNTVFRLGYMSALQEYHDALNGAGLLAADDRVGADPPDVVREKLALWLKGRYYPDGTALAFDEDYEDADAILQLIGSRVGADLDALIAQLGTDFAALDLVGVNQWRVHAFAPGEEEARSFNGDSPAAALSAAVAARTESEGT